MRRAIHNDRRFCRRWRGPVCCTTRTYCAVWTPTNSSTSRCKCVAALSPKQAISVTADRLVRVSILVSYTLQDYGKYGVYSAEDKQKLFRVLKAENQAKPRAMQDGFAQFRPEVEKQTRQPPVQRRQSSFNGRTFAAPFSDTSAAEKVYSKFSGLEARCVPRAWTML